MRSVPYSEAQRLWTRPERVVLAVSNGPEGVPDIIALGWHMRTSGIPPMLAISVGKTKFSHNLISETREFVFSVPGEDLWRQVAFCGTHSGRDVDKFKETGLTPVPAKRVKPPLIGECIVNIECRVAGELDTGDHTIFVGEVLECWVGDEGKRNLLLVGKEPGYMLLGEERGYRFGVVR
ncbi:MAG: flavin reductase family protein [Thermoproteota archaeon]